jgi:hypothetical protein
VGEWSQAGIVNEDNWLRVLSPIYYLLEMKIVLNHLRYFVSGEIDNKDGMSCITGSSRDRYA